MLIVCVLGGWHTYFSATTALADSNPPASHTVLSASPTLATASLSPAETNLISATVYLPLVLSIDTVSPTTINAAYAYLHRMINLYHADNTLRLVDSYSDNANDQGDTAWVYDNSLIILALLARGDALDKQQARLLADAFVYAQTHDPTYEDGRLRDGYHAARLVNANGTTNAASYGSSTGNMAWAMLGLLAVWEDSGESVYWESAEKLANWIVTNTHDTRGSGGFTGGVDGDNVARQWKSAEHNTDLVAAFRRLYQATNDTQWLAHSNHADSFVRSMWHEAQGHFWTGTTNNGVTPNYYPIPEDTQSWPILSLANSTSYGAGLDWALANLGVATCSDAYVGVSGVRFSNGGSGCSFEATAHMALALRHIGRNLEAQAFLSAMRTVLITESEMLGGLVAAPPSGAPSGFGFAYPHAAHTGATAWYLLAESGANPFSVLSTQATK